MNGRSAAVIALLAASCLFGYLSAHAQDFDMVEHGKKLYGSVGGVGCKTCHGAFGEGKVGPPNRGVNEATIREALARIPAMEFLRSELNNDDIKKIAAYTEWMGRHQLFKVQLKRGLFAPEKIAVHPGTPIEFAIENTSLEPNSIQVEGMEIAPLNIPARDQASMVLVAPSDERALTIICGNCRIKNGALKVEVTKAAKPYVPPPQPKVSPRQ